MVRDDAPRRPERVRELTEGGGGRGIRAPRPIRGPHRVLGGVAAATAPTKIRSDDRAGTVSVETPEWPHRTLPARLQQHRQGESTATMATIGRKDGSQRWDLVLAAEARVGFSSLLLLVPALFALAESGLTMRAPSSLPSTRLSWCIMHCRTLTKLVSKFKMILFF